MSRTAADELTRARSLLGQAVTEKEFQANVLDLARMLRWRTYHTLDSRGAAAGFPDLVMVRGPRLVMAELKSERGRLTEPQEAWLAELGAVQTLDTFEWRPADWPAIEEALR